jgi:hypothetical protein
MSDPGRARYLLGSATQLRAPDVFPNVVRSRRCGHGAIAPCRFGDTRGWASDHTASAQDVVGNLRE